MKISLLMIIVAMTAGCTGGPCNPPPILYPILLPVAVVQQIRHSKDKEQSQPPKPIVGGDSLAHPFVLVGKKSEHELRSEEAYEFWVLRGHAVPGIAIKYLFYGGAGRKIDAVYYRVESEAKEVCFYFDVTDVEIVPAQVTEPTSGGGTPH